MKGKVLIVDDEDHIRELVGFHMEKEGFEILYADDGNMALSKARSELPQIIIIDLMLPILDGLEACKILKANSETSAIPIIILTAKNEEIDKILGLELGADDYLTKPFSPRELVARARAILRRTSKVQNYDEELTCGKLRINFAKYEAFADTTKVNLTPKEYELLKILLMHANKVLSRDFLLENIWGYEYFGDTRTVDVHIRHLRSKLGQAADENLASQIETVRGVGYRYKPMST